MTVTGNKKPPYHTEGLRHCLEQMRRECSAGAVIAYEMGQSRRMAWFRGMWYEVEAELLILKQEEAVTEKGGRQNLSEKLK